MAMRTQTGLAGPIVALALQARGTWEDRTREDRTSAGQVVRLLDSPLQGFRGPWMSPQGWRRGKCRNPLLKNGSGVLEGIRFGTYRVRGYLVEKCSPPEVVR